MKNNSIKFVWVLQEGFDNPDIFTICKLADTKTEINRRQQETQEKQKIHYAKKFFTALQKELTNFKIVYKTRTNQQESIELIGTA